MKSEIDLNQRFHQLIVEHKGILYKVAKTYCRNDDDRQDLLQEIMVQIWKSLDKYNAGYAISTWLYRISLNVAISFYRKNRIRQISDLQLFAEQISTQDDVNTEKDEQLVLLEQFIAELNDFDKALIMLYLEDKSHAEISEIMGLSVTNVGTKLGRIKGKLKNKFDQINA